MSWKGSAVLSRVQSEVSEYSASGAIAVTDDVAQMDSSGGALAMTLADGAVGDRIVIEHVTAGNNAVVTPATFADGTTLTFNAAKELVELLMTSAGWTVLSNVGSVAVA